MTDPGLAGDIVRIPASEVVHIIDPLASQDVVEIERSAGYSDRVTGGF